MIFWYAAVNCGPLADPVNGMVMVMGTTPGSKAMYSCKIGFMLEGEMTRRCQPNGQWSGNPPTCKCKYSPEQHDYVEEHHCTIM